jgi:hypothetical protein
MRCTICGRKFRSFEDAVPDHIEPRGMGGAWRDDHPDNIQAPPLQPQSIPELAQTGAGWSGRAVAVCLSWKSQQRSRSQILPRSGNGDRVTRRPASEFLGSETMRPVAKLYREFCLRTAQMLEDEANRYANHPALQDEDQQFIQVLRQKCREWKQQIEKLDHAQMRAWDRTAG